MGTEWPGPQNTLRRPAPQFMALMSLSSDQWIPISRYLSSLISGLESLKVLLQLTLIGCTGDWPHHPAGEDSPWFDLEISQPCYHKALSHLSPGMELLCLCRFLLVSCDHGS